MYNRYIRNDQGTYTRIPEEEPRHTQGGTSPSGQPEHSHVIYIYNVYP